MAEQTDPDTAETPPTGQTSSGTAQPPRALGPHGHWYIREIVVGTIVMVLGSFLVWKIGIGTFEPPQTLPTSSVREEKATNKESIFTRETYATIQPGLTAWELEDILGPPHLRQDLPLDAVPRQLYGLPESHGESTSPHRSESATIPIEYEEMVWQSKRIVNGNQLQHIAVLLKNGEVIARRQAGVE